MDDGPHHDWQLELEGRYRLLGAAGQGGEGTVFLAEDIRRGAVLVAIKVADWSSPLGDPSRLSAEFLTLLALAHPAIARVRDFGHRRDGAGAWYSADWIAGSDLFAWAAGKSARDPGLLDLASQALGAIAYLERKGLVHGDIKPANLLVESDGDAHRLCIVDFGSAHLREGESEGERTGTRAYLPPSFVSASPDLVGLGLSLFHTVTGHLPFSLDDPGASGEWWRTDSVARPSRWGADTSPALDELIERLVSTTPERRFRDASEAAAWLARRAKSSGRAGPPRRAMIAFRGREPLIAPFARGAENSGGVTIFAGPPGSGRTRLLDQIRARARVGGRRVIVFQSPSDTAALAELEGEAALSRGARASFQVVACLANLPRGSLLLVDDADADPLPELLVDLVRHTAADRRRETGLAVVLVAADPSTVLSRLGIDGDDVEVRPLPPLDRSEIESWIADWFGVESIPARVVDLVAASSSGLPGGITEALEHLEALGAGTSPDGRIRLPRRLPERFPIAIAARRESTLERLRGPLRRRWALLQALPGAPSAGELESLGEGDALEWRLALEALLARGLIERRGTYDAPRFAVPQALRDARWSGSLSESERCSFEERALASWVGFDAKANASVGPRAGPGTTTATDPDRLVLLAGLLSRARRESAAVRACLVAARILATRRRFGAAIELLSSFVEDALRANERARTAWVLRLARVALACGRAELARELVERVPFPRGAPTWLSRALLSARAGLRERTGDLPGARADLEHALAMSSPAALASFDIASAELRPRLARLLFRSGESDLGAAVLREGRGVLEREPEGRARRRLAAVLEEQAAVEVVHGDSELAARLLSRAIRFHEEAQSLSDAEGALHVFAVLEARRGRPGAALELFSRAEDTARERGDRLGEVQARLNRAHACLRLRELDEAEGHYRTARKRSEELGPNVFSAAVDVGLAALLQERGEWREALRIYRRVLALRVARPSDRVLASNNLGDLYLRLGRLDRSLAARRRAVADARALDDRLLAGLALRGLGATLRLAGRFDEACAALEETVSLEEALGDPRHVGGARYHLGEIASLRGDFGAALRHWRAGKQAAAERGDRDYAELCELAVVRELAVRGRTSFARGWLERRLAREPAEGGGASPRFRTRARAFRAMLESGAKEAVDAWWRIFRETESSGDFSTAFALATDARELSSSATDAERREIEYEIERLLDRFARRLEPGAATALRNAWAARSPEGVRKPSPPERSPETAMPRATDFLAAIASVVAPAGESASSVPEAIATVIERLSETVPGAVVTFDPGPTVGLESLRPVVRGERRAVRGVESRVDLPGRRGASITIEHPPSGTNGDLGRATRERLLAAAAVIALLLEQDGRDAEARVLRKSLAAARRELRRLAEITARDKDLVDTARITRRVELADAARKGDEGIGLPAPPVAESRPMRAILARVPRIAESDRPVLLLGESGVGKDVLARWIHANGPRRERRFVAEICSIPESLLEAELFGFRRGAFTDAVEDRPGVFQRAAGGTLYLDEVRDLSPALQSRLTRVLDSRTVRPLGAEKPESAEFRLIASTRCRSLEELESTGLRPEFFFRLVGDWILIPPLRDRPEDIEPLVREFVVEYAKRRRGPVPFLSPAALAKLREHSWPGNIRELRNEVERALVEDPRELRAEILCADSARGASSTPIVAASGGLRERRNAFEREIVLGALREHGGNASQAARALRITRRHLAKLVEKHEIDLGELRRDAER